MEKMYDVMRVRQSPWSSGEGEQNDVVLSSRIRLARNFSDYPFPLMQSASSAEKVLGIMQNFCKKQDGYVFQNMQELTDLKRRVLVEKHLISPEHAVEDSSRAVVLNEDETVSIMVNEEDHLRLQCFAPGLNLMGLWEKANRLDDKIEEEASYAFDEKYGYLTCCPTNLGNGLRGSVMLHLPGLKLTKRLGILNQLSNVGMNVRGLYGEGSEAYGDLYQISNQLALGQKETDVLTNLHGITEQIIKEERAARSYLHTHMKYAIEDECMRAMGILSHARRLNSKESLELISKVRLGISMGIIPVNMKKISGLYLLVQPGYLQLLRGDDMDEQERDVYRAEKVKEHLKKRSEE